MDVVLCVMRSECGVAIGGVVGRCRFFLQVTRKRTNDRPMTSYTSSPPSPAPLSQGISVSLLSELPEGIQSRTTQLADAVYLPFHSINYPTCLTPSPSQAPPERLNSVRNRYPPPRSCVG
jgi:hypothetical protein